MFVFTLLGVVVKKLNRKLLFFPVFIFGVLVLYFAISSRPDVPIKPAISKARLVDVIDLKKQPLAPVVTGFGRVKPKRSWQAIAEVRGKVIYRNPLLEKGQILPADTLLLKIDPIDYEIAVAKTQANLTSINAKLAKITLDEKSIKTTLITEKRRLKLREDELARQKNLKKKGLTSQSALDAEQQAYYAQQTRVQDIESRLALLPAEKSMAKAELEATKLALEQAKRDLEKTQVKLPFTSRIASVNIEQDQVVTNNQIMVEAHGLGQVEVEAQISIHDMQILLNSLNPNADSKFSETLKELEAQVTLSSGRYSNSWQAKVTRVSDTVQSAQATVGVILEISLPNEQTQGVAATPSLVNGMFVQAQIIGKPSLEWVVPEQALRGDRLYFLDKNQLTILPVSVLFRHNEWVAINADLSGFLPTPVLVTNDLIPALEGMLLQIKQRSEIKLDEAKL